MRETLSKPQFAEMRESMKRRARHPPRAYDQPMSAALRRRVQVRATSANVARNARQFQELEASALADRPLHDLSVGPNMELANRPIFDLLHQGDMLLNNEQMRAVERSERAAATADAADARLRDRGRPNVAASGGLLAIERSDLSHLELRRERRQILSSVPLGCKKRFDY